MQFGCGDLSIASFCYSFLTTQPRRNVISEYGRTMLSLLGLIDTLLRTKKAIIERSDPRSGPPSIHQELPTYKTVMSRKLNQLTRQHVQDKGKNEIISFCATKQKEFNVNHTTLMKPC
jgi:hypothetical protein